MKKSKRKNKIHCAYVEKGIRVNFLNKSGHPYVRATPCCHLDKDFIEERFKPFTPLEEKESIEKHITLRHFKSHFKKGTFHPACRSCINAEKSNNDSVRMKLNKLEKENPDFDYLKLDVVMSNKCNLACPFCSQGSSSLIETLAKKYAWHLPMHWKKGTLEQPDTELVGKTCANLLKKYKIHTFKIIGGEPFLIENWEPIGKVLDENYCSDLNLEITTNGTIMNDEIIKRLSKAKHTKLRISMDSIGENYNFIRWPHNWEKMKRNLTFLRDNKPDNCDYQISILVNILNFEYLPQIEEFLVNENLNYGFDFTLKPVDSPLQWYNLPLPIIFLILEKVKDETIKNSIEQLMHTEPSVDYDLIVKDVKFYLDQRNMKPEHVLGPKTRGFLDLK